MKKRLISLLLLFTLVLSAMPLGVVSFASSAEANAEMTEADYNALYVQDNIAYSLDFFKMNEYWSPNGHSYEIPIGTVSVRPNISLSLSLMASAPSTSEAAGNSHETDFPGSIVTYVSRT